MLKVLKKKKVIYYKGVFLMYPPNKDEEVRLRTGKEDWDPFN